MVIILFWKMKYKMEIITYGKYYRTTEEQIEKLVQRAIEQGKLKNKADITIRINKQRNVWMSWKNTRRSFRFTIFIDGTMHSGFLETKTEF